MYVCVSVYIHDQLIDSEIQAKQIRLTELKTDLSNGMSELEGSTSVEYQNNRDSTYWNIRTRGTSMHWNIRTRLQLTPLERQNWNDHAYDCMPRVHELEG